MATASMRRSRRDDESYGVFKERLEAVQHAEHAVLSYAQEQRRLRIHLRRIVLERDGQSPPREFVSRLQRHHQTIDQLVAWKNAAVSYDQQLHKRQVAACVIQRTVRKWLAMRQGNELPSSSEFLVIQSPPRSPNAHLSRVPAHHEECTVSIDAGAISEPFQAVVELLGARDLPSAGLNLHDLDVDSFVATVQLVHVPQKNVLGSRVAPLVPLVHALAEEVQWDGQVLQVGIDPGKLPVPKVVEECSVVVDLSLVGATHSRSYALGQVVIAMDLLETPLAEKYALTRWFPIERVPGRGIGLVRGEVHISIRFLMRNPVIKTLDCDPDVWIPYRGGVNPVRRPEAPKRGRDGKRVSLTTAITVATKTPPLSPQRQRQRSPRREQLSQNRRGSPVRRARMEAISPPSSPSSYSSDSNTIESDRSPQKMTTPRKPSPIRRRSSGGILASAANNKRTSLRSSLSRPSRQAEVLEDDMPTASTMSESPKKPFLKRKPYKVLFQKLDWSKVGSKTDSNLGTSKSSGKSSPQRVGKVGDSVSTPSAATHSGAVTSPTKARLATVITEVHAACLVTPQTSSLAQMKYRGERKRLTTNGLNEQSLSALWTELHADLDGARYVELLCQVGHDPAEM